MKSRSLVALMLASILGVLPLSTVWAIVQVTQLRMSTSSDGTAITEFPTGTQEVFVNFEYNNANNEKIKIELADNEIGVEVFVGLETYTGSGKKNLSINGQKIIDGYISGARTRNPQLIDQINLAKNNTNPSIAQAQLPSAIAVARDLRGIALALRRDPSSANVAIQLDQAIDRLTQTMSKGTQLIDSQQTPADQLIERIGSELLPLAQSAVDSFNAALSGISSEPGKVFPGGSYLTSIKVGSTDSSATYVEWTVAQAATPTPSPTSTTAPSTSSQATATPTPTSGVQTASATPVPTSGQQAASATPVGLTQTPATPLSNLTTQPTARGTTPPPMTPLPHVTPPGGPSAATKALAGAATVAPASTVATAMSPIPGLTASPPQKAGAPPPTAVASAKDSSGPGAGMLGLVAAALLLGILALWVRKRV